MIRHESLAIAALVALPAAARADVHYYAVARSVAYTQSSNAQPVTPEFWSLSAVLFTDEPNEVLSGTLTFVVPPPMTHLLSIATYISQYASPYYTDAAPFLLDHPATTYTLAVDRGLGIESGDVFLPEDMYCPEIPYFTGDTYDRLQSYDAALPFDGTINGFTLAAGTNAGSSSVVVIEDGVPGSAWLDELFPGETDFQIPAGQLLPLRSYSIVVGYSNGAQLENAGFGAATSEAQFHRGTAAHFTTLPGTPPCLGASADANCDGTVDFFDIDPFLLALFNTTTYSATYCGGSTCAVDVNCSGTVDFFDIDPFLTCLFGGCTPCAP